MSQLQKNTEYAADQGQTCEETQGLQVAAVSSDVEELCPSSHSVMASSLKDQTCEETQSLEVTQVSRDVEETCPSSHSVMASSLKDQTCEETQSLELTQVSRDEEEACTSSHSLMTTSLKDQTSEETQSLDITKVSRNVEEPCPSSHSLVVGSLEDKTCEQTQSLQVAAVSEEIEEPCSSSHLMDSSWKVQTCEETQGLEVTKVSRDVEETSPTSHSLMSDYQDDSEDDTSSTSGSLQSTCSSYSSSSESDESLSSQELQGYPVSSPCQPDTTNAPVINIDSKVNFLVNYMLYKYQMKEIMSMADILRLIVREDEDHFQEILKRAAERVEMVFGLDVKEVDPVNHCYALFIKLGLTYDGMHSDEYSFPKTGLLILILGVVFMKGNRTTEEEIWEVLNPMGIYAGMNHFIFGDPRQLITDEFVKEQYLVYQPVANSDPVQYEYVWGPRAKAETSKMKVLEFVAKVHGTAPTAFHSQYEEALVEEEERTLAILLNSAGPSSPPGENSSAMGTRFADI